VPVSGSHECEGRERWDQREDKRCDGEHSLPPRQRAPLGLRHRLPRSFPELAGRERGQAEQRGVRSNALSASAILCCLVGIHSSKVRIPVRYRQGTRTTFQRLVIPRPNYALFRPERQASGLHWPPVPAVLALLFILDFVAVAGVFKTDNATGCGVDPGWECSHAWEQFFFVASVVLSVLFVVACFIWLIQWAECGRRRIYGPDERGRGSRRDDASPTEDRITRRAWADADVPSD